MLISPFGKKLVRKSRLGVRSYCPSFLLSYPLKVTVIQEYESVTACTKV